jgi:tetratricopeptide (TPR) repeat protein
MRLFLNIFSLLLLFSSSNAQDYMRELMLFNGSAKAKIYHDALPRYEKLINECPEIKILLYQRADQMFEDMMSEEKDTTRQKELALKKIENLKLRLKYFPDDSPIGLIYPKIGETMYKYNIEHLENQNYYFEEAWNIDEQHFTDPKSLYVYFTVYNQLFAENKIELNELFLKYDELTAKIEKMKNEQALISKDCLDKKENGIDLENEQQRLCANAEVYIRNYDKIIKGMNAGIGGLINCENIIPVFSENFKENQSNKRWLKIAATRLYQKSCTDSDIFIDIVDALNNIEPNASSFKYLGILSHKNGDFDKAIAYYDQALKYEEDDFKKASVFYRMAESYKSLKSYALAKVNYIKSIELKPTIGEAYLGIADMIADNANDCGDTTFDKRATYWLAEKYAKKAASMDNRLQDYALSLAKRYQSLAPTPKEIFMEEKQGKTIVVKCWINENIKVPVIKKD